MKTLMPFMWPKKDVLLQFRVLFCFLLLAGGRVVNLYVPIYNKLIGKTALFFFVSRVKMVFYFSRFIVG